MKIEEVHEYADMIEEEILIFSSPSYDEAIIGISSDNRVIYDYDLMVKDLMDNHDYSFEDAIEFIDYNTLGAHFDEEKDPIILIEKGEING